MPEHRKERNHETHGTRRKEPHRVHARLRKQRGCHSQSAREVGVDHLARTAEPQDRQRQALRMLEQAVRPLRRLRTDGIQGLPRHPQEELPRMLRVVPGLPRGRVRPPEQGPLRLQRMRARARLPAQETLLHRLRRPGQLQGHSRQLPQRSPSRRGDSPQDERCPHPRRTAGPVRRRDNRRQSGAVRRIREKHGLRMDRGRPLRREEARPAFRGNAQEAAQEAGDAASDARTRICSNGSRRIPASCRRKRTRSSAP